jgi:hypothetical protein
MKAFQPVGMDWKREEEGEVVVTSRNQQPPRGLTGEWTRPWEGDPWAVPQTTLMETVSDGFAVGISSALSSWYEGSTGGRWGVSGEEAGEGCDRTHFVFLWKVDPQL